MGIERIVKYECKVCGRRMDVTRTGELYEEPVYCCGLDATEVTVPGPQPAPATVPAVRKKPARKRAAKKAVKKKVAKKAKKKAVKKKAAKKKATKKKAAKKKTAKKKAKKKASKRR